MSWNKEKQKAYYLVNRESVLKAVKEYALANPEKIKAGNRKHRAVKRGARHEQYLDSCVFDRDGWVCGICGRKINKRLKYPHPRSKSIDHIVPLSKGGSDSPINVQAAHLRCNLSKNAGSGGQLRLVG